MRNAVRLAGELARLEPLRHTPAGLPLINFRVLHRSEQVEAGRPRRVEFEVECIATGELATELAATQPGCRVNVSGFLNRRNRLSAQLVLHATSTEIVEER